MVALDPRRPLKDNPAPCATLRVDLSRSVSPGRSFEREKSPFLEAKALLRPTSAQQGMRSDTIVPRSSLPSSLPRSSLPAAPEWKTKGGELRTRQKPLSLQGADYKHKAGSSHVL